MSDKTISYPNTPYLSKIKLPTGNEYYLKDKDARDILDAINADVYTILQQAMGTVTDGGNHLVNAENIKSYVDRIAEIGFDVVVLEALPHPTAPTEKDYNTYHNNIILIADATSTTGSYVEYVILRTNTGTEEAPVYTYSWERIGTTQVDLSGYLKNVSYDVATHTLKQTKNIDNVETTTDVHTFGDMADADTASGTYTVPTGSGTVTINQYDITGNESSAITGEGTTDIEYVNGVTGSTTSAIQFNYNSIKDSNLVYGETTGKSVSIVSGLTGTTSFNTNAIDDANLVDGGVASKSATVVNGLTGTTSFATYAINAAVEEGECLTFSTVTNATFGVTEKTIGLTTNAATTSSFDVTKAPLGLTTTAADSTGFEVTTKHIHVTHTTPTATVTVDKTTDTVTVNPVPQTQE